MLSHAAQGGLVQSLSWAPRGSICQNPGQRATGKPPGPLSTGLVSGKSPLILARSTGTNHSLLVLVPVRYGDYGTVWLAFSSPPDTVSMF
jgi:hypothetical protein